jgi:CheY-like chemotaxis protein
MKKILIVEDDPLMSRVYCTTFKIKGYEVEAAKDGEEGVAKALSFQPDMVVLDVMMPKKNGFEVLDELKSDPSTRNIPIIMLTNLAGEKDMESALSRGAMKYLIKSDHDPDKVADMITEMLGGSV